MTNPEKSIGKGSLILLLGALAALGPLSIDMYLPAFPAVERDLQTSSGMVGATLATFFVGLCLGQLIYGPLSDRIGRKKPLLVGIALYVAASVACFFVPSIEALLLLRFFQALGSCAGMVVGRAMIRDLFDPTETAKVFSMVMLTMGVAPILAPLMGQFLADAFGWRGIFVFMALFAAIVWNFVQRLIPDGSPEVQAQSTAVPLWKRFASVLGDQNFVAFALAGTLVQAGLFAYITGSPSLFIDDLGLSPKAFSVLFGLNALGLIVASQINNRLLAHYRFEQVLRWALQVAAVAAVILATMGLMGWGGLAVVAPLFVFLSSLGFIFPNSTAGALAGQGHQSGTASAVLGVIQYGGAAVASGLVGILHSVTSAPLQVTVGLCGVLGLLAFTRLIRRPTLSLA